MSGQNTSLSNEYYEGMLKAMSPTKTMTLNMPEREMELLDKLAETNGMSKTAIARQALRLYQTTMERMARGERQFWRNKDGKEVEMMPIGGGCGDPGE